MKASFVLLALSIFVITIVPLYAAADKHFTQDRHKSFNENAVVFSGNANIELAEKIAEHLGTTLGKAKISKFKDGEIAIKIDESVRGKDVYIVQSTCRSKDQSINDNFMELILMIRTMKRASTASITAVIPYYGYARQDRKSDGRVPISAADAAMLLEEAGVDRILTVDLHCGQIQGFFRNAPVDNLYAASTFISHLEKYNLNNVVVVSPDVGGVDRVNKFIHKLEKKNIPASLAMISKQRVAVGVIGSMTLIGSVKNSDAVIVDDLCDTGGTLVKAAELLKEQGAQRVFAIVTHPVFSGDALNNIGNSVIDEMIIADTIPLRAEAPANLSITSIAHLLAEAIMRIHNKESVSELFQN